MKAVRFGSYSSRSTVRRHVELAALEIDDAIGLLVAAAAEAHGDAAVLLRPPVVDLPSVSALTGLPL